MDRREFVRRSALGAAVVGLHGSVPGIGQTASRFAGGFATRPLPTESQLQWQRDEMAMFCHFGVNTFTNREWGDGKEDPAIFNPTNLDARQWARAARAGGFKAMILTAKHHDGFCLWPTATTKHSVASSPYLGGAGDVVRDFVDAARAEGLRPGLYLSPWDRNNPTYGDSPRYNDLYCDQLTELLSRYGQIAEVWFDGANGEGPNGKKQVYDWPRVWALVRKLQPDAVMFSDAGPDVRWCGNENGEAGDPNWSTVDPSVVQVPGVSGPAVDAMLKHGDPNGTVWRPAEADVSIRKGWFYHPEDDDKVRSVDNLVDLYLSSVGRNSKLLLNVPPTRDGLIHSTDAIRLADFRSRLSAMFENDLAATAKLSWRSLSGLDVDLGRSVQFNLIRLEEPIERGQGIAGFKFRSQLGRRMTDELVTGTTIGYKRIIRCQPTQADRVGIDITDGSVDRKAPPRVRLYQV
jgi:alpha-L-fucosidase